MGLSCWPAGITWGVYSCSTVTFVQKAQAIQYTLGWRVALSKNENMVVSSVIFTLIAVCQSPTICYPGHKVSEIRKWKANWIGHILLRNCLLKHIIEGKIKGEMEVARRRGRRSKKLLDDLKDRRGYSHFEGGSSRSHCVEESFWRRLWTCRQTEYWMIELALKLTF